MQLVERSPKSGLQKQSDTKCNLSSLQVLCNDDSIDDIAEIDYDVANLTLQAK